MRAMVIDDSDAMRAILRSVLRDLGFACIAEAADGQDGLSRCSAFGPDLVLVDLDLPSMDGLAIVRALRRIDDSVPIIMVSAEAGRDRVVEAIDAGVNGYVVKPFTPATLRARIEPLVAHCRDAAA
jgi:two-component system chemotaxis response regulator CheY